MDFAAASFCHDLANVSGMMRSDSGVFPELVVSFVSRPCRTAALHTIEIVCVGVAMEATCIWKERG